MAHWFSCTASTRRIVGWLLGKNSKVVHRCPAKQKNCFFPRFFVHLIPSLNYALFPLVETLTSDELRRNLLATVGMRSHQTLPTPCGQLGACPEVYNINEASQHILSIADNQFWQSKKLRKGNQSESDSERPKQSSVAQQLSSVAQQSLVLESHF